MSLLTIITGDCLVELEKLPAESVQCCVTSPPYWGLRDYGTAKWEGGDSECDHKQGRNGAGRADGIVDERGQRNRDGTGAMGGDCRKCGAIRVDSQLGLESTPEEYVAKMVAVFGEVRRVLKDDGTVFLNLGDSYNASPGQRTVHDKAGTKQLTVRGSCEAASRNTPNLKPKDLVGIPWRVAFALQADGWWLRQDIIWAKPNPMPESVTDRCTKSHEYIFLLTKAARYYYDQDAIKEPCKDSSVARLGKDIENQEGSDRVPGKTNRKMKAVKFGGNKQCPDTRLQSGKEWIPTQGGGGNGFRGHSGNVLADGTTYVLANKKSVWTVTTCGYKEAHFATFPPDLIKPCIMAGTKCGDTVLDPFGGSGTTGMVALELGRKAVLIELNPEYVKLADNRCNVTPGLPI